jgi:glucose-1-phosphate thymidylyltransferase
VEQGRPFGTVAVRDWFDCGKPETWLETSRVLLDQAPGEGGGGIEGPCFVAADVTLANSRIGPYVSVGPGSRVENCELSHCVIGADTHLRDCRLAESLVGDHCVVRGARGRINLGDFGEFELDVDR